MITYHILQGTKKGIHAATERKRLFPDFSLCVPDFITKSRLLKYLNVMINICLDFMEHGKEIRNSVINKYLSTKANGTREKNQYSFGVLHILRKACLTKRTRCLC